MSYSAHRAQRAMGGGNGSNATMNATPSGITLGFYYYDENGNPVEVNDNRGEFYLFETTEFSLTDYPKDNWGASISESECGIDWTGVTNAVVGLAGGVAEMAIGGASTYFSAGSSTAISVPMAIDGGYRTVANAQRLWHYFNGKGKLANAYPTSIGALAGKSIDMALGTSIYNVGLGQAVGGWGNDLTSFVVMGGTGNALTDLVKTPSPSTMLNYIFTVGSYPYSMYYNKPSK